MSVLFLVIFCSVQMTSSGERSFSVLFLNEDKSIDFRLSMEVSFVAFGGGMIK